MRFLFRLIPLLLGLGTLTAGLVIHFVPSLLVMVSLALIFLLAYGLFELLGRRIKERDFWSTFCLSLLFIVSGLVFFLFLETWPVRAIAVLIMAALITFFVEQLYRWFYSIDRLPSYTLVVSTALIELFTVFFLTSDLLGFRIFLHAPLWLLLLIFVVVTSFLSILVRWSSGNFWAHLPRAILLAVLFGELFLAILFLPIGNIVGGAIITIAWYAASGIMRIREAGLALGGPARRYALLAGVLILVVVFSARWV